MPWYKSQGISSVDDLDDARRPGRARVYALAGAHGAYGVKSTADSLCCRRRRERAVDSACEPSTALSAASALVANFCVDARPARSCSRSLARRDPGPAMLRTLDRGGHTSANYRERQLAVPFGVLIVAAALIALIPLALLERLAGAEVFHPEMLPIAALRARRARLGPDRRHARRGPQPRRRGLAWLARPRRAALRGELSTGALKAAGSLGLALFAMSFEGLSTARWLLAVGVLVLATNVFNLLDLRPGARSRRSCCSAPA